MTISQLNVRIGQEEHDHLEALAFQTEGILTKAGVVRLLIRHAMEVGWDPLDRVRKLPAYRVGAGNQVGHPQAQLEPLNAADAQDASAACQVLGSSEEDFIPSEREFGFGEGVGKESEGTPRKPPVAKDIPDGLSQHSDLILEFWRVKKGSRGQTAWKLLITELTKLQERHGHAVVKEQLELGINAKWYGVVAARYEQFRAPKAGRPAEPEVVPKHPASRLFRNGRFVDEEEPVTNPLLADAF